MKLATPPLMARRKPTWVEMDEEASDSPAETVPTGASGGGAKRPRGRAVAKRLPKRRPAPEMRSAGGASSSGPSAGEGSSSWLHDLLQKSVDDYMALDAKRRLPKFQHIANCTPPSLIWYTNDVELWLGGVDHLWTTGNIPNYTTADRVPEVGSIGLMGRD